MPEPLSTETLAEGKYLRLVRSGRWEFVQRVNATSGVIVAALTDYHCVLFVEQFLVLVGCPVIELPAGLVGDHGAAPDEPAEVAAKRELDEETGYVAGQVVTRFVVPSSAGLTDEMVSFVIATRLKQVHDGGGDSSEDILVHKVPLTQVDAWLDKKSAEGYMIGARVYTGLYLLQRELKASASPPR